MLYPRNCLKCSKNCVKLTTSTKRAFIFFQKAGLSFKHIAGKDPLRYNEVAVKQAMRKDLVANKNCEKIGRKLK